MSPHAVLGKGRRKRRKSRCLGNENVEEEVPVLLPFEATLSSTQIFNLISSTHSHLESITHL